MYFLRSIWKNIHLTEFFTRAVPVVPVTIMRYDPSLTELLCIQRKEEYGQKLKCPVEHLI